MMVRHFTLDEVNALVPLLLEVSPRIHALLLESVRIREQRSDGPHGSGLAPLGIRSLEDSEEQADRVNQELGNEIAYVHELGGQVKGLDPLLVDFPARLNGKTVLLCWREGETHISTFHTLEGGYAGRRTIAGSEDFGCATLQ
jgi:hypothetical protein